MPSSPRTIAKFTLGVLVGATAGAASALLMTPRSGAATRSRMQDQAHDAVEQVKHKTLEQVSMVRRKATTMAQQAGRTLADVVPPETREKIIDRLSDRVKASFAEVAAKPVDEEE